MGARRRRGRWRRYRLPHPSPPPQAGEGVVRCRSSFLRLRGKVPKADGGAPKAWAVASLPVAPTPALPRRRGRGQHRDATGGPGLRSGQLAVAVLVLLAAAAGAGIVAADLGAVADDGALRTVLVIGLGGFLVGAVTAGIGVLELRLAQARFHLCAFLRLDRGDLVLAAHAHARQQGHDFALDLVQHLAEQLIRFLLVLLLGLLLRIAAQVDALAQVVHPAEVLLPAVVEQVEHDVLPERAHG